MKRNRNGLILYEGPSLIDGRPVVVLATGLIASSANAKTGDMIQTWILRQDVAPHAAFKSGEGRSVCGDCPHAGHNNSSCYVRWDHGPHSVWSAYRRGSYAVVEDYSVFDNRAIRFGAAGDPCAVPAHVWTELFLRSEFHTGYTHQWRNPIGQWARGLLQASCDGFADYQEATAAGWKTFLVLPAGAQGPAMTAHCAASAERGKVTTCAQCRLCDGRSANVVIQTHGLRRKSFVPS